MADARHEQHAEARRYDQAGGQQQRLVEPDPARERPGDRVAEGMKTSDTIQSSELTREIVSCGTYCISTVSQSALPIAMLANAAAAAAISTATGTGGTRPTIISETVSMSSAEGTSGRGGFQRSAIHAADHAARGAGREDQAPGRGAAQLALRDERAEHEEGRNGDVADGEGDERRPEPRAPAHLRETERHVVKELVRVRSMVAAAASRRGSRR